MTQSGVGLPGMRMNSSPDRVRCDQLPYFSRESNQALQSQGRDRKQDQGGQEYFALGQNKLPSL